MCVQDLFAREHNMIATAISVAHPDYSDEKLFGLARLATAAIVAKIHTIDWTSQLIKSKLLNTNASWHGLFNMGPRLLGLVGLPKARNRGVPYALTEEFTAVYRLHPLIADHVYVDGEQPVATSALFGSEGVRHGCDFAPTNHSCQECLSGMITNK
jgi:hypothetical protein